MKAKKLLALVAAIITLTAVTVSAEEHTHNWTDDIAASNETTNAYACDCGAERYEDVDSIRDYVITLDCSGRFLESYQLTTKDGKIKLPIPCRDSDYQFEGWYTEDGELVTSDFVYETDTTLYAHWSIVGSYTLYFSSDAGSYVKPITAQYGATVNLESIVPVKDGYIFEGWYSDPSTKEIQITEYTFTEDEVLYAKWRDDGTQKPMTTSVTSIPLTTDEVIESGNYVDEKTGVPVTALWVQQQKALKELMEIHNSIFN